MPHSDEQRQRVFLAIALFTLLSSVYLLSYSGVFHSRDEIGYVLDAMGLASGQTTEPGHGGLFTVLLAGVFALTRGLEHIGFVQAMFLVNIPATALTGAFLFLMGAELGYDKRASLVLALLYALATPAWVYSNELFREPVAAAGLMGALYFAVRFRHRASLAFLALTLLFFGLAVATRASTSVAGPFILLLVVAPMAEKSDTAAGRAPGKLRLGVALGLVILFAGACIGLLIKRYPGGLEYVADLFRHPYSVAGLLVSPARGLLVFSPLMVLALIALPAFMRQHPLEGFVLVGAALLYLLVASSAPIWWGGWNWGPRFLVSMLPYMIFPLIVSLDVVFVRRSLRWLLVPLIALVLASVAVQVIGITVGTQMDTYTFMEDDGESAFDPHLSPLVLPQEGMRHWAKDLAWPNVDGSLAQRAALLLLPALIGIASAAALVRYRRAAPSRTRARLLAAGLLSATVIAVIWALLGYYQLDRRYNVRGGYAAAISRVVHGSGADDLLMLDHWSAEDVAVSSRLYNFCKGSCPTTVLAARETWQLTSATVQLLDRALANYQRIWLIPAGANTGDPSSVVEHSLNTRSYLDTCEWSGTNTRVCLYYNNACPGFSSHESSPQVAFGDTIRLGKVSIGRCTAANADAETVHPGEALLLDLTWETAAPVGKQFKVSLQLLDAGGRLQKALDREPLNSFRPTNTWLAGETISDKYAFVLPDDLPAGSFRLALILYDPQSGTRLATSAGDSVALTELKVAPAE